MLTVLSYQEVMHDVCKLTRLQESFCFCKLYPEQNVLSHYLQMLLLLMDFFFNLQQINGIALDNKSLSECESLLRNCCESLSISLMKVPRPTTPPSKPPLTQTWALRVTTVLCLYVWYVCQDGACVLIPCFLL